MSKILLINGSPNEHGCTYTALKEIADTLLKNDVKAEILYLGKKPIAGCIACGKCYQTERCIFNDKVNELLEKLDEYDGIVVGSPVYYAGPPGSLCAILDRVCFSASTYFKHKPAACVVNCRRGGASAAFERLNKYFTILEMPVVSSQYWNSTHGTTPDELRRDLEGLQTMRTLGNNMAYMLKSLSSASLPLPPEEEWIATNFIR